MLKTILSSLPRTVITRTSYVALRTGDVKRERESWDVCRERHLEAFCGEEWFEDIAHNVDLMFFASLELLPDDRVVKHVEFIGTEFTEHLQ